MLRRRCTSTAAFFLLSGAAACSPDPGDRTNVAKGTGVSTIGGGGTAMGGGKTGAGDLVNLGNGSTKADGSDICVATSQAAEKVMVTQEVSRDVMVPKPVALYLMQDRSGSMNESTGIPFFSPSKWQQTVDAIKAFVVDPSSDRIDVALGFFPSATGQCTGENYDTPVVPLGRLLNSQHAQAIDRALADNSPSALVGGKGTPIEGGLRGAVNFCLVFEANHPDEKCAVVLITDGAPTECGKDGATLNGVAADAFQKAQVKTFTIGMNGADPALLNGIAAAGQTDCSPSNGDNYCNVSTSATAFSDALKRIRETILETITEKVTQQVTTPLDCEFKISPPPEGQVFNRDEVNVRFTHDGTVDKILQVPSEVDCGISSAGGWYYDDPNMPTKIKVCSATCAAIKASTGDGGTGGPSSAGAPRVDILLGCQTETAVR
jgi:von Willebrand factor type A domain